MIFDWIYIQLKLLCNTPWCCAIPGKSVIRLYSYYKELSKWIVAPIFCLIDNYYILMTPPPQKKILEDCSFCTMWYNLRDNHTLSTHTSVWKLVKYLVLAPNFLSVWAIIYLKNQNLLLVVSNLAVQFQSNKNTHTQVIVMQLEERFVMTSFGPIFVNSWDSHPKPIPTFLLCYWTFCYNLIEINTIKLKLMSGTTTMMTSQRYATAIIFWSYKNSNTLNERKQMSYAWLGTGVSMCRKRWIQPCCTGN